MGHTKGPWIIHKDEMGRGYEIYGNAPAPGWGSLGHQEVCRINAKKHGARRGMAVSYTEHPDDEANARLIAAAPELLEACKEALSIIEKYSDVPVHILALKQAITKAEGK
ncbi:MAG: hypothetical protein LLG40_13950 [Deltaproteobacteria bacterium]|nr:hypothetical protein [Deltaproteobacteria bacterium]